MLFDHTAAGLEVTALQDRSSAEDMSEAATSESDENRVWTMRSPTLRTPTPKKNPNLSF